MPSTHKPSVIGFAREADEWFDELRERVEAGAGGERGRQIVSEFRINHRHACESSNGLRRLTFTLCSGDDSTALRVTSEPVPAVVGMAMNGADGFVNALPRPMISR